LAIIAAATWVITMGEQMLYDGSNGEMDRVLERDEESDKEK
jgi:hypothetical protein